MRAHELPADMLGALLTIERTLWQNDAEVYHGRYTPEAILVFPGVGRIDRETAVAAISAENAGGRRWAEVHMTDAVGRWLISGTAALISYRVTARWNYEVVASSWLCATVYVLDETEWMVAFHQQTAA